MRICNPLTSIHHLIDVRFERITNPYSKFRRITNPPKHIALRLNYSRMYMLIVFIFHIPELWMNHQRPPFAFQKAVNCTLKGHLLTSKRRPFAKTLIIKHLHTCHEWRRKEPSKHIVWTALTCSFNGLNASFQRSLPFLYVVTGIAALK